jgi:hypothetical protein
MITRTEIEMGIAWCQDTAIMYERLYRHIDKAGTWQGGASAAKELQLRLLARERVLTGLLHGFWWKRWFWTKKRLSRKLALTAHR